MPEGRWQLDDSNTRRDPPREILSHEAAAFLAGAMRLVVTTGTARRAMAAATMSIAGKTGTAQLDSGEPHSWFAGFAPYQGSGRRIAFAVVVEHGGYGGQVAAPIAREVVEAAAELQMISPRMNANERE
jgi:peptidoglycan glycosyltransferase